MSSTDSINHQQIQQDVANAASQYAQYELEYQSRQAQQKLLQALHKQNSETAGGEILGLGAPASYEVLNKAINSKVGQEVIKRGKQFYNDYEEFGWDKAKERLYSSVQKDLMAKTQELQAKGQQKLVDLKAQAETRANSIKEDLQARANGVRDDLQTRANGIRDDLQARANGVRDDLQARANGIQDDLQARADALKTQGQQTMNDLQETAQDRATTIQENIEGRVAQGEQELNGGVRSLQNASEDVVSPEGDLNQMMSGMYDYARSRVPLNITSETTDPEAGIGGDLIEGVSGREIYSSLNINPNISEAAADSLQESLSPLRSLMSTAQQQVSALGNQASSLAKQATQSLSNRQLGSASEDVTPAANNTVTTATTDANIAPKAALDGVEPATAAEGAEGADAAIGTGAEVAGEAAAGASDAVPGILDTIGLIADSNPVTALVGGLIGAGGLIASIVSGFKDLFGHDDDKPAPPPPVEGLYANQLGGH
jgi:hypothetical protein